MPFSSASKSIGVSSKIIFFSTLSMRPMGALKPGNDGISSRPRCRAPLSLPPQPVSSGSLRRQTKAFSYKRKCE
ncbi:hypothetical protein RHECNPAF_2530048 [Rhizobium etli CNPAF512]|nr:hypothetical protein RHECNPAF_2530048 [Rhizobium etli CNPAF512]